MKGLKADGKHIPSALQNQKFDCINKGIPFHQADFGILS